MRARPVGPGAARRTRLLRGALVLAFLASCGGTGEPDGNPTMPGEPAPNRSPTARIEVSPASGAAPLRVRLDGSGSSDPDGPVAAFRWALGDGGEAEGPTVERTYDEVGLYVVRLTVEDEDGAVAVARDSVFVVAGAGDGDHRIEGSVWLDADADGQRDAGEPPVPGTTVFLDGDGDGVRTPGERATVSGPAGGFAFDGLDGDRTYTVTQELPLEWTNTHPGLDTDDDPPLRPGSGAPTAGPPGPARIVQGREVPHDRFPFMVTLLAAAAESNRDGFFCGGTLIGGAWVLTAGHCVDGGVRPDELAVLVGTGDLTRGGQRVGVERIRIEPTFFNGAGFENDMAVLELRRRVLVSRIDLMDPSREDLAPEGDTAVAVGWGRLGQVDEISTRLRAVEMPIFDQTICQNLFGIQTRAIICGGREGGGPATCFGDSGGPLAVRGPGGRWIQIGVTSFTLNCGQALPSGFTRVAPLVDFIRSVAEPEGSGSHTVDFSSGPVATVRFGNFR